MELLTFLLMILSIDGATIPPPPTPEIKKMIANLDDDVWRVREKASQDLEKQGYKAIRALMDAKKNPPSAEVRRRAEQLLSHYFSVCSDDKDTPMPTIWMLDNDDRFPKGYTYTADTDQPNLEKNDHLGGRGWCKDLKTDLDVGAYYYQRARKQYNEYASRQRFSTVEENDWLDEEVGKEAMRLYVREQLLFGKSREDVKKLLNKAVKRMKTHTNLHRHYPDKEGGFIQKNNVAPGPLIRQEEVPSGSEWRFMVS